MNELLIKILQEKYLINTNYISKQRGGWASLAYKVESENGTFYFLKVYDKSRKSTSYLTEHIDIYLPIVDWIENQTSLKGKIIRLVKTQFGNLKYEDENYRYILFDYIDGETVGEQNLTEEQVIQLAKIVSQLHNLKKITFDVEDISETFELSFTPKLIHWTERNYDDLKVDIQDILKPNILTIKNQMNEWNNLSKFLKTQSLNNCLCHTDIHHWNIITDKQQLYLLDWEGIKFAPPEADIFSIYEQPYFNSFMKKYYELNPDYQINDNTLRYYQISRKLQDIFEFIEQLQFDKLNQNEYRMNLNYLIKEVNSL